MMKKVIIRLAQVAVFLAIVFGCVFAGTMAYLSHTRKGVHPISYGENENAITESFQPPKEMTAGANILRNLYGLKIVVVRIRLSEYFWTFRIMLRGSQVLLCR